MRLSLLALFVICSSVMSLFAKHVKGQEILDKKITITFKNESLFDALERIRRIAGVQFFYATNIINPQDKVTVPAKTSTLGELLSEILDPHRLNYVVADSNKVVIRKDKPYIPVAAGSNIALSAPPEELTEKNIEINGRVIGASGEFLTGVTVQVKGGGAATKTDENGFFRLSVPENATLVFSYVGYKSQEVPVNRRTAIEVTLQPVDAKLDEVVVVGYGTQKKVNLTGAVAQVSAEVLKDRPITNLGQGLQGVVANLNINPGSGAPGRGVSFNIRGNTSINGGGPLVLVNGVQMDPNLINPADIESISVLKDAASAAIYGARAAFGVILITTKGGKKNQKSVVSLSTNLASNKPTVVPEYMNSMEYATYMNEGFTTTNGRPYFDDETMTHIRDYFNDPVNTLPVFHHSSDAPNFYRYNGNTNWTRELLKETYPMQQHNVSITGGSDKITYYTSLGYFNQKGISKPGNEKFDRYNFVQNVSYDANSWLNFSVRAVLNNNVNRMNPQNKWNSFNSDNMYVAGDSRPIMPVYHPDGHYAGYSGNGYFTNMAAYLSQGGYQKSTVNDLWLTGAVKITPLPSWTINIDYTYNKYAGTYMNMMKEYWDYDALGPAVLFPHTTPNAVTKASFDNRYTAFNAYSEYEKTFAGKHYTKIMVGFNQEYKGFNSFDAQRQKLISNDIEYMSVAYGDRFVNDAASEFAIRGTFARLNYTYDNRYLIELNGRYDGSSRFPANDRFAFFPSASVGWRISNENFFSGLSNTFQELKLRASYGNLGNQTIEGVYYPYIATYSTAEVQYLLNGERPMSVYAPGLVSPTLTWEKVSQYNFGLDFVLLDNRLSGSFDLFRRDTKDMLTKSRALPAILATSEPRANAADMKTNGYEVSLSWNDRLSNDIRYGLGLVFADARSVITKYDNPNRILSDYYVGQKLGEIWGFETEGLFQSDAEAASLDQSKISGHQFLAGDIKFVDQDKDGKITRGSQTLDDHGDLKVIGNNTPRYSFGIKGNIEWKGFDLSIFFQGIGKRQLNITNRTYFLNHYNSEWAVPQKFNTDYWTPDNTDAYFPRPRVGGAPEINEAQTRFLQNAAYIRLKQLTVGYNLPVSLTERVGIKKVRIYLSGNNIWEATKMVKIFDPEDTSTDLYPFTRVYSFGANITL
ncbi:MAG: TonB-dependent receptor [Chitinophagaceae bacterium]|nr:TonB-dependent receptor [Chitinophagaceae bacterium]